MDNDGTHTSALIRRWFAKRPRFHAHVTPTYASWLNLIERWFAALETAQLRRGVHRSGRALTAAICEFMDAHNADGRPFIWTKSSDDILASIKRFAQRTLRVRGVCSSVPRPSPGSSTGTHAARRRYRVL